MASDPRLLTVLADLRRIFADRLESVVSYGRHAHDEPHCLALVATLTMHDLVGLAAAAPAWHHDGVATPLVVTHDEFARSLDAFPIEYGEIIDTHSTLHGDDPFVGVRIDPADVRRAAEVQAASLLLHLRENFIDSGGHPSSLTRLVRESAPAFASLLRRMARLDDAAADTAAEVAAWATTTAGLNPRTVGDVLSLTTGDASTIDAARLFGDYLDTVEALRRFIDRWPAA